MATGGIGGVHRGFPNPPDVSADLGELARTPALVVSAGEKSLLDVPATAELLETLGVPVLGFRVDTLPLFYGAEGGPPVSARVESAEEAARVAAAHWELGGAGLLVGRPPDEPLEDIEPLIEEALAAAASEGVSGQAVTPFVLSYLHRESGGRTQEANRALIAQNARLAGEIASRHCPKEPRPVPGTGHVRSGHMARGYMEGPAAEEAERRLDELRRGLKDESTDRVPRRLFTAARRTTRTAFPRPARRGRPRPNFSPRAPRGRDGPTRRRRVEQTGANAHQRTPRRSCSPDRRVRVESSRCAPGASAAQAADEASTWLQRGRSLPTASAVPFGHRELRHSSPVAARRRFNTTVDEVWPMLDRTGRREFASGQRSWSRYSPRIAPWKAVSSSGGRNAPWLSRHASTN